MKKPGSYGYSAYLIKRYETKTSLKKSSAWVSRWRGGTGGGREKERARRKSAIEKREPLVGSSANRRRIPLQAGERFPLRRRRVARRRPGMDGYRGATGWEANLRASRCCGKARRGTRFLGIRWCPGHQHGERVRGGMRECALFRLRPIAFRGVREMFRDSGSCERRKLDNDGIIILMKILCNVDR